MAAKADTLRLPAGDKPAEPHAAPSSGRRPAHAKTPARLALGVQVPDDTLPEIRGFASTSSCAAVRSLVLGTTPVACVPPLNVTVMLAPGPGAVQLVAFVRMVVAAHPPTPTAPPAPLLHPLLTVPAGHAVQVDTLATHAPALRLPA